MTHDPIADMLTRLRNAGMARHEKVEIPASKLKERVLRVLKEEGYIRDFEVVAEKPVPMIKVYLKYGPGRKKAITGIRQISKPGLRVYAQRDRFPGKVARHCRSLNLQGNHTDRSANRARGRVICYVW